jgi:bacterial/archaeal transporter family-2 protein
LDLVSFNDGLSNARCRPSHTREPEPFPMSSHATLLAFGLVAFVAGVASALQTTMNGALGRAIGDPVGAALWSFATGTIVVLVIYVLRGGSLSQASLGQASLGQASLGQAPQWSLFGGVMGAVMVLGVIYAAPRIGLTTALIAIILGQAVMSILLDAAGVWGEPKAVTAQRLTALGLLIAGFLASRN